MFAGPVEGCPPSNRTKLQVPSIAGTRGGEDGFTIMGVSTAIARAPMTVAARPASHLPIPAPRRGCCTARNAARQLGGAELSSARANERGGGAVFGHDTAGRP